MNSLWQRKLEALASLGCTPSRYATVEAKTGEKTRRLKAFMIKVLQSAILTRHVTSLDPFLQTSHPCHKTEHKTDPKILASCWGHGQGATKLSQGLGFAKVSTTAIYAFVFNASASSQKKSAPNMSKVS